MSAENESSTDASFEVILEQLEGEVARLERGDLALEEALGAFERGMKLVRQGDQVLTAAQARVELLLRVEDDGTASVRPLDPG